MKQVMRYVLVVAIVAAFVAPVLAEPPPRLYNAGTIPEERPPVKLPGTTRTAGGDTGGGGGGVGFSIDAAVAQRSQPGPLDLGGGGIRVQGPLTATGGGSAVYGPRQQAEREIRRVQRQLD